MKFHILISLFFLLNCNHPSKPLPKLKFSNDSINLGQIPHSSKTIQFKYWNEGNAVLVIKKISLSCDCTSINDYKKVLKPGDSAVLTVKYDPPIADTLQFHKIISLLTNGEPPLEFAYFYGTFKTD